MTRDSLTPATPTSSPVLHGRYRIEEQLGAWRLAVVYRAYDERLQRPVLVHLFRRDLLGQEPLRQRFVQEAQNSARRSHPSLLDVFDSGEVGGRPFMITEYVSGRTLREIGALSLEEALLYFRQVVGAVAACQEAGVPH
ncbi:MAG TPA: protein kinase, partial [Roseiflexaceae bacterium]|nr:protein kinase [Roseiflexaceae bacterium]